jgi:hypothetical protein
MDPRAPFLVRRVLLGVVIGCALLGFAFLGWVGYRTSQFYGHEKSLVAHYHGAYTACVKDGGEAGTCAAGVVASCSSDPFWSLGRPFVFLPGIATDDRQTRCRGSLAG